VPAADWDWERICNHPATTWERIVSNFDMINEHIDLSETELGSNPNLDIDLLLSGYYKFPNGKPVIASLEYLADRSDFTARHIEKYGSQVDLSENPNITIDYVINHTPSDWIWSKLSRNPGISIRDILAHPNLPWRWDIVGLRSDLIDFLRGLESLSHINPDLLELLPMNKHLTHSIAVKFGISTRHLFCNIPIEILKLAGLYHPDKTIADYMNVCITKLREKYPDPCTRLWLVCVCKQCVYELRKRGPNQEWHNAISRQVHSYRDVIDYPEFNWNFGMISRATFE
jgi:hypothetical protein